MADEKRAEWEAHLTPDLRAHFERMGEELVQFDVSHHRYKEPNKHYAALYWLGEKRQQRDWREKATFRVVIVGVVLAGISLIISIAGFMRAG